MSALDDLLKTSSEPIGKEAFPSDDIPIQLMKLLRRKNGFFAFESALEVFPLTSSDISYTLEEWNQGSLWRDAYEPSGLKGVCFAQDIFGGQFVLLSDEVFQFDPETAESSYFAQDIEEWAKAILSDYDFLTGSTIAHEWQKKHGPLAYRNRLLPITPFVLGGEYNLDNLVATEASRAMRIRAAVALELKSLPDGSKIVYRIEE